MKTQEMDNEYMKEVLLTAQKKGLANPVYREYLIGITNTLLGGVSVVVFVNSLQGYSESRITKEDVRDFLPKEYRFSLSDDVCNILLTSIEEYYMAKGYQVVSKKNLENKTIELVISVV